MWEDEIVSAVRRTREELSARFDYDVKAIFADIRSRQAALGERLVSRRKGAEPAKAVDRKLRSAGATPDSGATAPAADPVR